MNEASELPPLIRAGLVHVHFETIHPFFDGNGCIGRLLKMRETADLTLDFLFSQPVVSITEISKSLEKAYSTIRNILQQFIIMGIVSESTTQKRNKLYRFEPYLALLEKEYL